MRSVGRVAKSWAEELVIVSETRGVDCGGWRKNKHGYQADRNPERPEQRVVSAVSWMGGAASHFDASRET